VAYNNWVAILQYAEPVLRAWQGTLQETPFCVGTVVTSSAIVSSVLSDRVVHQV
jgi:hypothetical protein